MTAGLGIGLPSGGDGSEELEHAGDHRIYRDPDPS